MKTGTVVGIGCGVLLLVGLVCGGILGVAGFFGVQGIQGIQEMNQTCDAFLAKCGSGDTAGAYASAASTLQAEQTADQFAASAKKLGLTEYQSATWNNWNRLNDTATISGTMTKKSGGTASLTVKIAKEGGVWKVASITSAGFGDSTSPTDGKPMPTDAELKTLTKDTLLKFNEAVQMDDFTAFHATIADLWKREIDADGLRKLFVVFVDNKVDIGGVKATEPVFDKKPAIDKDGFILLDGYCPTTPLKVSFTLRFAYEHPNWKLVSIRVKTGN